jgi:predicted nucleotidyltransferase
MGKLEAIRILKAHAAALKTMGARALYLFGSTARGEADQQSDLDIFVDIDQASKFSLVELIQIQQFLEDELSVAVDVTTRDSLHPLMKADIEKQAVRIY